MRWRSTLRAPKSQPPGNATCAFLNLATKAPKQTKLALSFLASSIGTKELERFEASISNTSATGSYEVDPDGVLALSSNKVVVGSAGIVKVDVNFFVQSSGGADNDISITINQTVESSDSVIQEIVRRKDATGLTAISFSYIQYVAANTSLFYQIKRGSAAALLTTSTFTVTKLT